MDKGLERAKIFKKYPNKWAAFTDDDRFISAGSTLDEVLKKARKRGFTNPVTTRIPDFRFEFIL